MSVGRPSTPRIKILIQPTFLCATLKIPCELALLAATNSFQVYMSEIWVNILKVEEDRSKTHSGEISHFNAYVDFS